MSCNNSLETNVAPEGGLTAVTFEDNLATTGGVVAANAIGKVMSAFFLTQSDFVNYICSMRISCGQ